MTRAALTLEQKRCDGEIHVAQFTIEIDGIDVNFEEARQELSALFERWAMSWLRYPDATVTVSNKVT